MDKNALRFRVKICNIVIAVLCLLSIAAYFFMPFWKISLSYTVSPSMIEDTLNDALSDASLTEEEQLDIDATEIVGADGTTLSLSIRLKTTDILAAFGKDGHDSVQAFIDDNISNIVDEIYPTLSEVISNTAKVTLKSTIYSAIREELQNANPDSNTYEIEQKMQAAGVDESYINNHVDNLMETIDAGAPKQVVSHQIVGAIDESCNKLATNDPENFSRLTEEDKQQLLEDVDEILDSVTNEQGEVNMDELLAQLLLNLMEEEEKPANNEDGVVIANVSRESAIPSVITAHADSGNDAIEDLKVKLTDLLLEQIPSDVTDTIVLVLKITGGVLFFTMFTWLYILIKMLAKVKKTNNAVKLKLPIWLGWLPCLVLVLIPSLFISLLKNPSSFVADLLGPETMKDVTSTMNNFSISFSSASLISFIVAMVFMVFCLAYYGRLRRKLRKIAKAEKKGIIAESKKTVKVAVAPIESSDDYKTDDYDPNEVDMDGYSDEELDSLE